MSWMERVAEAAESRLRAAGIQITLGGEPTLVPLEPEGPEWSVTADGPTKLAIARAMARDLQQRVWPGSTLLYCPGKRYDGEVNPRWALRLFLGDDGTAPVRWPGLCQPGLEGAPLTASEGPAWLERLGGRLGIALQPVVLRDPFEPERRVWAAPLSVAPPEADDPAAAGTWAVAPWPLEDRLRELTGAPGPAGLRLPLEHLPEDVPRQVLTLEIDPDGWELFLPPLEREPLRLLLQAVADSLGDLAAPRLSGVLPFDAGERWQVLGLTADPGVLEINLPVCHSWLEYHQWLQRLEEVGGRVGLRSWKDLGDDRQEGTGGGNHLLWGGPDLAHHPFFSRPAWLTGILRYWQRHPSLAYLFCGPGVGPSSQSPRPDEAIGECFDLELAYRAIEQAEGQPSSEPFGDFRGLIGETLRHLHADRSGNNHRSEISFDKFWNPGAPAGCLGLVEFRALESLPSMAWSSTIALLWTALAAHLLEPSHRPAQLHDWGSTLHDRQLLPSQLWADLEAILADLAADGLVLDPAPFRTIWEWRFPPLLRWQGDAVSSEAAPVLELRPTPEPWPLICDTPVQGGFTSRFIDGSLRRFEVVANPPFRRDCQLLVNGRPLPLEPSVDGAVQVLAVRFRFQRLYPCLHPAIEPHMPLDLVLRTPGGDVGYRLHPEGHRFEPCPVPAPGPVPGAPAWQGRQRPTDLTIDLRID
ncbi:transglutaminase family protein [Cyanobium sp. N5-Cardenillas]|uniref:transglutaminase family protein n=1 Tax=Cyanobium sp. N5-Cardenillas TaxID=2823720 RepID=UPI0020CEB61F|nr:transglutaminase family protein [Cyanobium sp. N5-Cardenillas]MCP9784910.1 transglutaminase family protein [Cyanobium sp. N5-Cardenillas]